ncbi:MAG: metallophosphoesterase [Alphaproteobacteria bacterium]|nr:metallophosphoesterase [Alphaproteobacteria bacterium]
MKLIQISDPHFGTERPPVVEALARLVRDERPDMLIVSGDLTQRARRSQFDAARAFFDRLDVRPTLVIPGNHDVPLYNIAMRALDPYAGFRRAFGDELEPTFESDEVMALTVRTTRRYRHIDGEVSGEQIDRVATRLAAAGDSQLRIVVTHQPVAVTRAEDEIDLLHGHEAAVRRWSQAGADLILGGHIHLPYIAALHERHADLPRRMWAVQAGTATSWRIRHDAGNSVNLIRYDEPGHCRVERWDYKDDADGFSAVAVDDMVLDRVKQA